MTSLAIVMKAHPISSPGSWNQDQNLASLPPMSLDLFMEMSGLSSATCWRYRRRGWLRTVTIAGRHYITREEIAEFNNRAMSGEFAGKVSNPSKYRKPSSDGTDLALAA